MSQQSPRSKRESAASKDLPSRYLPPLWAELTRRWPAVFDLQQPRPLKVGISNDLIAAGLDPEQVGCALQHYCNTVRYRTALITGAVRIDLAGQPAGIVNTDESAWYQRDGQMRFNALRRHPRRTPTGALPKRPQPDMLTEANTVKGQLEITIKINTLPQAISNARGAAFRVDCDGTRFNVLVRPRLWNRLTAAASEYPQWVAVVTGKLGPMVEGAYNLLKPSLQVYEKKLKAGSTPQQAASTPAAAPKPSPAKPPHEVEARPFCGGRCRRAQAYPDIERGSCKQAFVLTNNLV